MGSLAAGLAFPLGGDDVVEPSVPEGQINHVAAGLSRLYQQFRKPNIIALLTLWLERYNDLEQVFQDLLNKRNIFNAEGVQLDLLGRIVQQPRNGLSDDSYRRYLFARIAVNNSNGLVEDLIKIASLIINDTAAYIQIDQQGMDAVVVRIGAISIASDLAVILIDLLRQAPLAGVRLLLEWSESTPSDTFTLDNGPGLDTGFLSGVAE